VLRTSIRASRTSLPLPPRRPATARAPAERRSNKPGDATVRVGADTLQDVFDQLSRLGQIPAPLAAGVADLRASAAAAREVHRALLEARRRIGPPRPWGPPAAAVDAIATGADRVADLAARLERVAERVRGARARVAVDTTAAQAAIASMRTTSAATLFDRVQAAALADARRAGRTLRVDVEGAETLLDRELAEILLDPLLQLARNALAHGTEPAPEREARGKPAALQLRLAAEAAAGAITLTVEDDGAGVDVAEVRRRAVESGALAPELASLLDDVRLLAFLFRPGFSTRSDADLLAGRGLGLDVVLAATHRAGGTLRLRTRRGHGFSASISVPSGASLLDVLWVRAGAAWLAIPAVHVLSVAPAVDPPPLHLAALVAQTADGPGRAVIRIAARPRDGSDTIDLAVDDLGLRDEVHLRPIEPLVRATGPWSAAIAWGDEIRMSLDPQAVVDHAHTLLHPPDPGPTSQPPTSLRLRA
jgi:two-component system chemotaxis sensor kinase CheA